MKTGCIITGSGTGHRVFIQQNVGGLQLTLLHICVHCFDTCRQLPVPLLKDDPLAYFLLC